MRLVKAAVYYETGPPDVFRYEDVPDPVLSRRCRAHRGRGDQHRGRRHAEPRRRRDDVDAAHRRLPVRGHDPRGRRRRDRSSRRSARRRARSSSGSHAELVAVPALVTWPVPDGADIVPVACVPVAFGTADDCLFEFGHLQAGETVLIQAGAGGVGVAAIQLAKRAGRDRDRDRVERRAARAASRRSASTTASTTRTTAGSTRCARSPAAAASTSSSTRSAARSSPAALQCLAYRGPRDHRRQRRPRSAAVRRLGARHGQPVAHRRVPRRRDRRPSARTR